MQDWDARATIGDRLLQYPWSSSKCYNGRYQKGIQWALAFLLNRIQNSPPSVGQLAIKHHPDKNPDDPHAEERFKDIAIAYQTLSDDNLRRKYNEFGPKESAPEGGYIDPEGVFGAIFGGECFVPIIGTISLAKDMKSALQEAEDGEEADENSGPPRLKDAKGRDILSPEERERKEEKDRIKAEKEKQKAAEVSLFLR